MLQFRVNRLDEFFNFLSVITVGHSLTLVRLVLLRFSHQGAADRGGTQGLGHFGVEPDCLSGKFKSFLISTLAEVQAGQIVPCSVVFIIDPDGVAEGGLAVLVSA